MSRTILDFSRVIHRIDNLLEKFRYFETICGAGLIHNTRGHAGILLNWQRNFDYYVKHPEQLTLSDWSKQPLEEYTPSQVQFDSYFETLLNKAESFLVENVNLGKERR